MKGRLQVMIWIWEQALYVGLLAGYVLDLGTGSPSFDRVDNFSIPYDDTHFKLGNFHSSDFFCAPLEARSSDVMTSSASVCFEVFCLVPVL